MAISIGIGNYIRSSLHRGTKKNPFHPSLVDYWNFSGKSNFDKDRNTIKGIKGNILNAYNFGWSLGSGYGLFKENYLTYRKAENVFVTDDHSITVMNFISANNWIAYKYGTEHLNATRVRVTGLTANNQLAYGYSATNDGARVLMPIPKDGIYDLPESVVNTTSFNVGFIVQNTLTKNVTIEQIPQYEGAIVTDGRDDYLKLDKVGYKIGTIILKYVTLFRDNTWRYVFDVSNERNYLASNKETGVFVTSAQYKFAGDYMYLIPRTGNNPTTSNTPFHIGCNASVSEFSSMALYDIAIYEDILTNEEVLEQIDAMNSYKLVQDYTFDKSNSDVDRDKVYNKLNPNEYIELYNFGYSLNNGYGLYSNNFNDWTVQYGSLTERDSSFVEVDNINGNVKSLLYLDIRNASEGSIHTHAPFKIKISGTNGTTFTIRCRTLKDGKNAWNELKVVDGIYEIPEANGIYPDEGNNKLSLYYFNLPLDKKIKVEEIPEYPNHLVFDGVNDYTSSIPNFNVNEGTVLVQYNPIDNINVKMLSNGETGTYYAYTFFIGNVNIQSRGADSTTRVEIPINVEDTISVFAYDNTGINLFSNGTFKTSNHVNSKYQYAFGKDWNSAGYSKLALKRVKIFNKKLTENQIKKEYNKLLNE